MVRDEVEAFVFTFANCASFVPSFPGFSAAVGVELPKSRDVPGVRGVLVDEPNDANAPEPKPKAEEAPLVGEATFVVVRGAMPLNELPFELSPPKRFAGWYERDPSDLFDSFELLLELFVDSASLLELGKISLVVSHRFLVKKLTLSAVAKDCPSAIILPDTKISDDHETMRSCMRNPSCHSNPSKNRVMTAKSVRGNQ